MRREILLFVLVGAAAFLVDAGILYVVKSWLGVYAGRGLSFLCAVVFTWLLNRTFTFNQRPSDHPWFREFFHYLLAMLGGGAVNYLVYAACVSLLSVVARHPVLGVAAGSCAGLVVNFSFARLWIFKAHVVDANCADEKIL